MAGRGTDIVLGGNVEAEIKALGESLPAEEAKRLREEWQRRHEAVVNSGGLHIIGTERHESRRIDNQLRGRSGRQGDPGSSRFYLSLQDNLMRIFASERVSGLMQKLGMQEGEAIEHRWVTKAIENAQRKVEGRNFDIRKQLLEYDDVANDQRKVVYEQRNELMESESVTETINAIRHDVLTEIIDAYIPPQSLEELWDIPGLEQALADKFLVQLPITQWLQEDHSLHEQPLREKIAAVVNEAYEAKGRAVGDEVIHQVEKVVMLQVLDGHWKEHLAAMDYLRQGIHLRGIAQKNPKHEFRREAFEMFGDMLGRIKLEVVEYLTKVQIRTQAEIQAVEAEEEQRRQSLPLQFKHAASGGFGSEVAEDDHEVAANSQIPKRPFVRQARKIGRNEPCPCGSGKKYKNCHGKLTN
jgi:preprotein translocase subunit SecA